jgi:sugar O-acyltransferase (sialic acid O-acetyltransferase NeuD family)
MTNRLILVGAGELGREVFAWMLSSGYAFNSGADFCFIDDNVNSLNICNVELICLGGINSFFPLGGDQLVAAIASPVVRSVIVEKLLSRSCNFVSYVHPSVHVSLGSTIGQGCILLPNSLVSRDSVIGDFSIVNCFSSVGHDVSIGSFVTISSHVDIMGRCVVDDKVFMGSGSRVLPGRRVGESAVIGAGATAARSVASGKTLYAPLSKIL